MKHPKIKSPARTELQSLIHRIGGAEKLGEILFMFYERMSKDLLIGYFFENRDLVQIAKKQSEFILMAAGLIDRFEGKGPASAHSALPPIFEGHFDRRLVILREVLVDQQIEPALINQWVQFEESFRAVVVSS